jgi:hypothetical protein
MAFVTLAAGFVVAAFSDMPASRLQIVPVRGIKLAFLASWLGSVFILYSQSDLRAGLRGSLRRGDLLAAGILLMIIAYALVRSGNAPSQWKPGGEQGLRDRLETLLAVRPRFKEFAFGYPLLLLGGYLEALKRTGRSRLDGRPLLCLGVIGLASMINTFCHLHSPVEMALWRSLSGIALGTVAGCVLILAARSALERVKP